MGSYWRDSLRLSVRYLAVAVCAVPFGVAAWALRIPVDVPTGTTWLLFAAFLIPAHLIWERSAGWFLERHTLQVYSTSPPPPMRFLGTGVSPAACAVAVSLVIATAAPIM